MFFSLIILGVGTVIYYAYLKKQDKDNRPDLVEKVENNSLLARISSVTSSMSVIIFLLLGFIWGLWHPGWLVFLLTPIVTGLVKIIKPNAGESVE